MIQEDDRIPAEEEEVRPGADHDGNGQAVLRSRTATKAEWERHLGESSYIHMAFGSLRKLFPSLPWRVL